MTEKDNNSKKPLILLILNIIVMAINAVITYVQDFTSILH